MFSIKKLLILCCLVGVCKADRCENNFTISDLPNGAVDEVLTFITKGLSIAFHGCDDDIAIQDDNVKLWLSTRNNPDTPILLDKNNPSEIDLSKPVKIIVPGWLCNVTNDRTPELTKAYLQRYDCNVIGIDWSQYSIDNYGVSYCYVPLIAKVIAAYICKLTETQQFSVEDLHMLGHSMGGQMAGIIGQEVQQQCSKMVGRITGLDPAGPLYQLNDESTRLDKSDASFVDVIHTNQGVLGYAGPCGTVDFFPNCGSSQKGCGLLKKRDALIGSLLNIPLQYVGCNHLRAIDYMIESINSRNFVAKSCSVCSGLLCGTMTDESSTEIMGEDCSRNPAHGQYLLFTNGRPPFAKSQ